MPTKFTVGLTKKIGQPDYGSLGASCTIECELDQDSFANNLDQFHEQVRRAYVACAQAVNDELARHRTPSNTQADQSAQAPENGGTNRRASNGNGSPRPATDSQIRAIRAIASRQRIDLGQLLRERRISGGLDSLTISEASQLIDELKNSSPAGGRR
jgi:uncharacterized protein YgbK (DUF1537 family)